LSGSKKIRAVCGIFVVSFFHFFEENHEAARNNTKNLSNPERRSGYLLGVAAGVGVGVGVGTGVGIALGPNLGKSSSRIAS
jgi:hypothetical protein